MSTFCLVGFLRVWQPSEPLLGEPGGGPRPAIAGAAGHDPALERDVRLRDQEHDSTREKLEAYAPYIIIVVVFAIAKLVDPVEQFLFEISGGTGFGTDEKTPNGFSWPGLDIVGADGEPPSAQTFAVLLLRHARHRRAVLRAAHRRRAAHQARRRGAHLRRDARAS